MNNSHSTWQYKNELFQFWTSFESFSSQQFDKTLKMKIFPKPLCIRSIFSIKFHWLNWRLQKFYDWYLCFRQQLVLFFYLLIFGLPGKLFIVWPPDSGVRIVRLVEREIFRLYLPSTISHLSCPELPLSIFIRREVIRNVRKQGTIRHSVWNIYL